MLVPADVFFVYFFPTVCLLRVASKHVNNMWVMVYNPSIKRVTPFWRKTSQPTQLFSGKIRFYTTKLFWRLRWFKGRILIALPFCKRTRVKKNTSARCIRWMSARFSHLPERTLWCFFFFFSGRRFFEGFCVYEWGSVFFEINLDDDPMAQIFIGSQLWTILNWFVQKMMWESENFLESLLIASVGHSFSNSKKSQISQSS